MSIFKSDILKKPEIVIWLLFFAGTAFVALLVQLVLLPHFFPAWHDGHGLLAGGDWVGFHQLAVELAQAIKTEGWSAWLLRPEGQAPAGIAAAIYAVSWPEPWVLVPLNAALHATAGLVLFKMIRLFVVGWKQALLCCLPFVVYPSAMAWYTQIHKDGFYILGAFLFVYGLLSMLQIQHWRLRCWITVLSAALSAFTGVFLIWVVRPYAVEIIQVLGVMLALPATGVLLYRHYKKVNWLRLASGIVIIWLIIFSLSILNNVSIEYIIEDEQIEFGHATVMWEKTPRFPAKLDNKLYSLISQRNIYIFSVPGAASVIDADVSFQRASDLLRYLPRAVQILLLAPFPVQWFGEGSLDSNTFFRRVSAFEMAGIYLALVFLLYGAWTWRKRLEFWILLVFCCGMMLPFAYAIPNVGTIYRFRYGYIMILVALGLAAFTVFVQKLRIRKPGKRNMNL